MEKTIIVVVQRIEVPRQTMTAQTQQQIARRVAEAARKGLA